MSADPYLHLDTMTMPVEGDLSMGRHQLLWEDPATGATVQMTYGSPGFSPKVVELLAHGAHRHYHNTVIERHYVLGGDYPVWHWSDLEDEGKLSILRRHTYLENPPKTLHGIRPETLPKIASQILVWNNGSGTSVFEADAPKETIEVPLQGHATPKIGWDSPRLLIMDDLPWRAHPRIKGWKIKKVASPAKDLPPVVLVNIPADSKGGAKPPSFPGAPRYWIFVLSGDLSVNLSSAGQASELSLREGHFLAWPKETTLSYRKESISDGGCVCICVGHDLAQSRR
jgi:hypothetical protein